MLYKLLLLHVILLLLLLFYFGVISGFYFFILFFLPERFDWSIMGWTILRRAFINLSKMRVEASHIAHTIYIAEMLQTRSNIDFKKVFDYAR